MSNIVDINGKPVDGPLPSFNRPEDVLRKLLADIENGVEVKRVVICLEGELNPGDGVGFGTRSSQMTLAESIAIVAIARRLLEDNVLGK